MASVHWTELAEADLEEIAFWIGVHEGRTETAVRILREIRSACERSASFPVSGTAKPELGEGHRLLSHRRRVIIFRPIEGGIEVLRVLDGSRDLDQLS
jgi:toxin ParE1/3/4